MIRWWRRLRRLARVYVAMIVGLAGATVALIMVGLPDLAVTCGLAASASLLTTLTPEEWSK